MKKLFINMMAFVAVIICAVFTACSDNGNQDENIPVTGITINGVISGVASVIVEEGSSVNLDIVLTPSNASRKSLKFTSSDENVATVDQNGTITGVKKGDAVVTVETVGDSNIKATCNVKVTSNMSIVPFAFYAITDGVKISMEAINEAPKVSLLYSTDGSNWKEFKVDETEVELAKAGQYVAFKAESENGVFATGKKDYNHFVIEGTGTVEVKGNLMYLLNGTNPITEMTSDNGYAFCNLFTGNTQLVKADELILKTNSVASYSYSYMFKDCKSLVSAPILPAMKLDDNCYYNMFNGCSSLTEAPLLPATTLVTSCYSYMFANCKALVDAPELPAMNLASYCYTNMYKGCTSLENVPTLPAEELATSCYNTMFGGCTSLKNAPAISAKTLADKCCVNMFSGCASLENVPELAATSLAKECYSGMFQKCTSLKDAPALPATELTEKCYYNMFYGCASLVTAPALPATTVGKYSYQLMFKDCTSLKDAPALPATTLDEYCYDSMFSGCTSIEKAPELPATTLAKSCYSSMFLKCSALKEPVVLPATDLVESCYCNMFENCANLNSVTTYATKLSSASCVALWLNGAGVDATEPKLYVPSSMVSNSSIITNKGCFTVLPIE